MPYVKLKPSHAQVALCPLIQASLKSFRIFMGPAVPAPSNPRITQRDGGTRDK